MEGFNTIELTKSEQLLYNFTLHGDENVIGIAIVENTNVELTKPVLIEALFYMYKRHPLMRAHLRKTQDNEPYLEITSERHATIDHILFEWTRLTDSAELTRELEIFNMKVFDYENDCLLWRFKIFEYQVEDVNKLAFTIVVPFFITDGVNVSVLCIELVNLINAVLNGKECEEMYMKLEIIDNMYELVRKSGLMDDMRETIIRETGKIKNDVFFTFDQKFHNLNDSGLKINLLALDRDTSGAIIEYAKKNRIKITGFMLAAIFYTLKQLYEENGLVLQNDLSAYVSVNLRMRLMPEVDFGHMRNMIALTNVKLIYPDFGKYESIWKDAVYANRQLKEELRTDNGALFKLTHNYDEIDRMMNVLNARENIVEEKLNELDFPNKCDISLSNIGVYLNRKNLVPGPLKITEMYHGDSLQSFPSVISSFIIHVTDWNDRFMFQLSTNRRSFSGVHSDRFMELFQNNLKNAFFI